MSTRANRHWIFLLGLSSAALAFSARSAQAADTSAVSEDYLQEIVVTAQRHEERLQDVPLSVAVFTQSTLDAQIVRDIDDLTRLSPGVEFSRNGAYTTGSGASSDIGIRGISSIAGAATTAIYIDDTPIQARHINLSSANAYPALFDLDRVEVLRGPQGTLFGASAEGGAVRFISPDPGLKTFSGYDRAEFATTDNGDPSYEIGAAAGGPIVEDTVGFRVSASFRRDGGWVNRVNFATGDTVDADSNWQRTSTVRAALTIAPTEHLLITPSLYYQEQYQNDTAYYWKGLSDPSANEFNNGNVVGSPYRDRFYLPALKVAWDLGAMRLVSNTSYFSRDENSTTDATFADRADFVFFASYPVFPYPPPGVTAPQTNTDRQYNFVQEVRLESTSASSALNWVAGLFYQHAREDTSVSIRDPSLPANFEAAAGYPFTDAFPPLLPGGYMLQTPYAFAVDKQVAAFGQIDWKIVDSLKLTAGLRVSSVDSQGAQYSTGPYIGPLPASNNATITEHPVTPKVGISYQPARDQLFYASVSKGYRIGGVNAPLSSLCAGNLETLGLAAEPTDYKSDSVWSYEIGAKNSLFNGRLQVNSSAFYIKWRDIQNQVYLPNCGFSFFANLGNATSKGADTEILARPFDKLLLGLNVSYTNAQYDDTIYASPTATASIAGKGDWLPVAPWNIVASAEYELPFLADRHPYVRADYQVSTAYKNLANSDPTNIFYDPAVFFASEVRSLSARAGFRWRGFDVSLFGQNLTNSHPVLFDSRYFVGVPIFFDVSSRPRTVGVTATYHY